MSRRISCPLMYQKTLWWTRICETKIRTYSRHYMRHSLLPAVWSHTCRGRRSSFAVVEWSHLLGREVAVLRRANPAAARRSTCFWPLHICSFSWAPHLYGPILTLVAIPWQFEVSKKFREKLRMTCRSSTGNLCNRTLLAAVHVRLSERYCSSCSSALSLLLCD